ncbi:MAG: hypothetical protein D6755_06560 [Anaerolineae bacterium]|nr:MAG: hypothetical protein D6755_06560 [Anaerolineae bacterium]
MTGLVQIMEFFFNPDIAYVILMLAFGLAVMAVLAPGTGLLEVGAIALFVISGYQILQMPTNLWALVVVVAGCFPLGYALVRREGRVFVASALGLIFVGVALLFRSPDGSGFGVHWMVVLVTTVIEGGFLWFVALKSLEAASRSPVHDLETLVGQRGEARTEIHQDGSVYVMGELWSARSESPIPAGTTVQVVGRDGFYLLVRPVEE